MNHFHAHPQFSKLKPGARVVSHQFEIPGVPPDQTLVIDSTETGGQTSRFPLDRSIARVLTHSADGKPLVYDSVPGKHVRIDL